MDFGRPFRLLARPDVTALAERALALGDADWVHTDFNRQAISGGVHGVSKALYFRKEWQSGMHRFVTTDMWDVVDAWAEKFKGDPDLVRPFLREDVDDLQIYTFWQWLEWQDVIVPVLDAALAPLAAPNGVLARAMLVCLPPGKTIAEHVDGQRAALRNHRIHVALSGAQGVVYRAGSETFEAEVGDVFELNNCIPHSVEHRGPEPRINLMIDYLPDAVTRRPFPVMRA